MKFSQKPRLLGDIFEFLSMCVADILYKCGFFGNKIQSMDIFCKTC